MGGGHGKLPPPLATPCLAADIRVGEKEKKSTFRWRKNIFRSPLRCHRCHGYKTEAGDKIHTTRSYGSAAAYHRTRASVAASAGVCQAARAESRPGACRTPQRSGRCHRASSCVRGGGGGWRNGHREKKTPPPQGLACRVEHLVGFWFSRAFIRRVALRPVESPRPCPHHRYCHRYSCHLLSCYFV